MPNFLVEEITVRENGESAALPVSESLYAGLQFTLDISHVKQQQDLDVDIVESRDGVHWSRIPLVGFPQKTCCGTYTAILPRCEAGFLKAVWRVNRWARGKGAPLFRISLKLETPTRVHLMAGAA